MLGGQKQHLLTEEHILKTIALWLGDMTNP